MTEKRDYWKEAVILREKALEEEETARRIEEQKNKEFRAAPRRRRPQARVPIHEQMNDQASKLDPEVGSTPRARAAASRSSSSSSNGPLEEVLKGQAQQAGFLQHIWTQHTQMQKGSPAASGCLDRGHSATYRPLRHPPLGCCRLHAH